MLQISKPLLSMAEAALDNASDKNILIPIEGTPFVICKRKNILEDSFYCYFIIEKDGEIFLIGTSNLCQ